MGRVVHSVFNDGKPPVSASATQAPGKAHTPVGRLEYEVARPLELGEIPRVIADYAKAAENAKRAGFDGGQLQDRKSVVEGKSVSVRVDLGGGGISKKKTRK